MKVALNFHAKRTIPVFVAAKTSRQISALRFKRVKSSRETVIVISSVWLPQGQVSSVLRENLTQPLSTPYPTLVKISAKSNLIFMGNGHQTCYFLVRKILVRTPGLERSLRSKNIVRLFSKFVRKNYEGMSYILVFSNCILDIIATLRMQR